MPHVINEIKLDFKDVLLRPKRSALKSRADVRSHMTLTDLSGFKIRRSRSISTVR